MDVRELAAKALCTTDPAEKAALARALFAGAGQGVIAPGQRPEPTGTVPGRPLRPELLSHLKVARRSPFTPDGLAALIHAIAHIEFNAIKNAVHSVSSRIAQ